jgi:hypothetical protein
MSQELHSTFKVHRQTCLAKVTSSESHQDLTYGSLTVIDIPSTISCWLTDWVSPNKMTAWSYITVPQPPAHQSSEGKGLYVSCH